MMKACTEVKEYKEEEEHDGVVKTKDEEQEEEQEKQKRGQEQEDLSHNARKEHATHNFCKVLNEGRKIGVKGWSTGQYMIVECPLKMSKNIVYILLITYYYHYMLYS